MSLANTNESSTTPASRKSSRSNAGRKAINQEFVIRCTVGEDTNGYLRTVIPGMEAKIRTAVYLRYGAFTENERLQLCTAARAAASEIPDSAVLHIEQSTIDVILERWGSTNLPSQVRSNSMGKLRGEIQLAAYNAVKGKLHSALDTSTTAIGVPNLPKRFVRPSNLCSWKKKGPHETVWNETVDTSEATRVPIKSNGPPRVGEEWESDIESDASITEMPSEANTVDEPELSLCLLQEEACTKKGAQRMALDEAMQAGIETESMSEGSSDEEGPIDGFEATLDSMMREEYAAQYAG